MHRITAILFAVLLTPGCFSDAGSGTSSTTTETDTDETSTGSSGTTGDGSTSSTDTGSSEDTGSSGDTDSMDMGVTPDVGDDPVELPDPLAWYIFNGNPDDEIGEAHGLEVWADVPYVAGYDGLAAQVDLNTGHFDFSAGIGETFSALANASAFSLAIRLQPRLYQGTHTLFGLGNTGEALSTNALQVRFENGSLSILTETGDGGEDHSVELGPLPSLDEWHELVLVFDGPTVRAYEDGLLLGESDYVPVETTAIRVTGGSWVDHANNFEGLLDDIRIYDTVLTEEEALLLSEVGD